MSEPQPRKPAGLPQRVAGTYDTTGRHANDGDLDPWADTAPADPLDFDGVPVDEPDLEADILARLPETLHAARIDSIGPDGFVTGVDKDGKRFRDTTDPTVSPFVWDIPDDLKPGIRPTDMMEHEEGTLWRRTRATDPTPPKPERGARDREPWCVKAAKLRYKDRFADVRVVQGGRIMVELKDGSMRVMDAPAWVPPCPPGKRRIHVPSGRWRLIPASVPDGGEHLTVVCDDDVKAWTRMANDVIGSPVERILSIDGTGRVECLLKDGTRTAITLAGNEPRPDEGVTIYRDGADGAWLTTPTTEYRHRGKARVERGEASGRRGGTERSERPSLGRRFRQRMVNLLGFLFTPLALLYGHRRKR